MSSRPTRGSSNTSGSSRAPPDSERRQHASLGHRSRAGASSSAEALATAASEPPPAGSSRTGTALKGGLALGLHRGLLLAVSLVMVPLAAHTLPRAEFGAWLLLSTIPALIGFLDLGLANGLVTIVATESPRGDEGRRNIHRYVSSAAFLLLGVGVTLAAAVGGRGERHRPARGDGRCRTRSRGPSSQSAS